jgi:superfamily II RNA helicase
MPLLRSLHESGMLPAIIFNFERSACELYAKDLLAVLEASEQYYRRKYKDQLEEQYRKRRQVSSACNAEY